MSVAGHRPEVSATGSARGAVDNGEGAVVLMDEVPNPDILAVGPLILLVDAHGPVHFPAHAHDPVELAVPLDQRTDRPDEVRRVPRLSTVEVSDDVPLGGGDRLWCVQRHGGRPPGRSRRANMLSTGRGA